MHGLIQFGISIHSGTSAHCGAIAMLIMSLTAALKDYFKREFVRVGYQIS